MAYDKKYIQDGDLLKEYLDDREDRIEEGFESIYSNSLTGKGKASDLNKITENGIYSTFSSTENKPSSSTYGGVCLHINRSGTNVSFQIHINVINGDLRTRASAGDGTWYDWK